MQKQSVLALMIGAVLITSCQPHSKSNSNDDPGAEVAQTPVRRPKEQRIIWEYNGDYVYETDDANPFFDDVNSLHVDKYCKKISESFASFQANGWMVKTVHESKRNVPPESFLYGGVCEGRELFIER